MDTNGLHRKHLDVSPISVYKDGEKWSWFQYRYVVVFAAFLMNAMCFMTRLNLSVAIVAISLERNNTEGNITINHGPQYDWDAPTRGKILSSFFWGYVLTQIPSGYLTQRYGGKILLLMAVLISVLGTYLFVPAAALGWKYVCATRFCIGLAQGAMMPSSHDILAHWSPPTERGRMAVFVYSGHLFGTVIAMSGSGILSAIAGWPSVFYVSGSIGAVCVIFWAIVAADSPADSRFVSKNEVRYIEDSINNNTSVPQHELRTRKQIPTPWREMLTSMPVWSILIAQSTQSWGFWTLATQIPSYMKGVLNINIAKNGLLSALPYCLMFFCGLLISWASDYLIKKRIWRIGTARKVANSIGQFCSAVCLVVLGYAVANETLAIGTLAFAHAVNAGVMSGYLVNHLDLSPNFAGAMMGITNFSANIMSVLGPLCVGYIVTENDNANQWRLVFLIAAAFYVSGGVTFLIYSSGEVQPWNSPTKTRIIRTEDEHPLEYFNEMVSQKEPNGVSEIK